MEDNNGIEVSELGKEIMIEEENPINKSQVEDPMNKFFNMILAQLKENSSQLTEMAENSSQLKLEMAENSSQLKLQIAENSSKLTEITEKFYNLESRIIRTDS